MNSGREVAIKQVFAAAFQLETDVMQDAFLFYVVNFGVGDGGFVIGDTSSLDACPGTCNLSCEAK